MVCLRAHYLLAADQVDDAIAALQTYVDRRGGEARALAALQRCALVHGRMDVWAWARTRQAEALAQMAANDSADTAAGIWHSIGIGRPVSSRAAQVAAWHEAALVYDLHLQQSAAATRALAAACAVQPDLPLLHSEAAALTFAAGAYDLANRHWAQLNGCATSPQERCAALVLQAALLRTQGDSAAALTALGDASLLDPEAALVEGMRDDLWAQQGQHTLRASRLQQRAQQAEGEHRAWLLWRLASVDAVAPRDPDAAIQTLQSALNSCPEGAMQLAIARHLLHCSGEYGAIESAYRAASILLQASHIAPAERSAIYFDLLTLLTQHGQHAEASVTVLQQAARDPAAGLWAATAERMLLAQRADFASLAEAHRRTATQVEAVQSPIKAAHHCAAARAWIAAQQPARAEAELQEALRLHPGHPYALALWSHLLHQGGQGQQAAQLLQQAASNEHSGQAAAQALLAAGAAAEVSGNAALAYRSYKRAMQEDPRSLRVLWVLRALAERNEAPAWYQEAMQALAASVPAGEHVAWIHFEWGQHQCLYNEQPAQAAAALRRCLPHDDVGPRAALWLMLLPERDLDPAVRIAACQSLQPHVTPALSAQLWREQGQSALCRDFDQAHALRAADAIDAAQDDDRWTRLCRLACAIGQAPDADAWSTPWLELGRLTNDRSAASAFVLHGLRARALAADAEAFEDACVLAHTLSAEHPDAVAAALAMDESLGGADDAEARAEAMAERLRHSGAAQRPALQAAHARILTAAEAWPEALAALQDTLDVDGDDAASWEALRVAARGAAAWPLVVQACDKLSGLVSGSLRADLLEESATVLIDQLQDLDAARHRLQEALAIDMRRDVAGARLHDVLVAQNDTTALLELVTRRLHALDDPAHVLALRYEQARLLRAQGELAGALIAVEEVLAHDEVHAGALALAVEIHVARAHWSEAVALLDRLAAADVPKAQRRLAWLGAADFLERHLDDKAAALTRLQWVVADEPNDAALYERIATLAADIGAPAQALEALHQALSRRGPEARPALLRRMADLRRTLGDPQGAQALWLEALHLAPDVVDGAAGYLDTLSLSDKRSVLQRMAHALDKRFQDNPLDVEILQKMEAVAAWSGDGARVQHLRQVSALCRDPAAALQAQVQLPSVWPAGDLAEVCRLDPASGHAQLAALGQTALMQAADATVAAQRLDRHAAHLGRAADSLRAALQAMLHHVGVQDEVQLYVGGDDDHALMPLLDKKGRLVWLAGSAVTVPLRPVEQLRALRAAASWRLQTLPWLGRSPRGGAALLQQLRAAAGVPGDVRLTAPTDVRVRMLQKSLARKAKRAIVALHQAHPELPDGDERWCAMLQETLDRVVALSVGQIAVVVRAWLAVQDAPPAELTALKPAQQARLQSLVRYWISPEAVVLCQRVEQGP
ncbi:MAG: hypothetical protein ACPGUV_07490 [Polyangiales bacterium]